jgi:hypothetical protein
MLSSFCNYNNFSNSQNIAISKITSNQNKEKLSFLSVNRKIVTFGSVYSIWVFYCLRR